MKAFLDEDFLLETKTAKILYHQYAEPLPIIDYHCHVNPQDIAEDRRYRNITEVWLGGDHYKWRAMRQNGVPEHEITGRKATDPYRVFAAWAGTLPQCVGNPLYHWTYLELKRYFGITTELSPETAREIYAQCGQKLAEPEMSVRGLIAQSNVRLICTTDDPADNLHWHRMIREDASCQVQVLPTFRPDSLMNVDKPGFPAYLKRLEAVVGYPIESFADIRRALHDRIAYFAACGCRVSDHGLDEIICAPASVEELDIILRDAKKKPVGRERADCFRTAVLLAAAKEYHARGWVMQIHYGCLRNASQKMLEQLGPDTGFDAVGSGGNPAVLAKLLSLMEQGGYLPRMVLYSLNGNDNSIITSVAGCFQSDSICPLQIQSGSAWWFCDHRSGMEKQLTELASLGTLGNFIGMLTDSRSFLSYTRHEYFRRILCNLLGRWMENGEIYPNLERLGRMVADICYYNAVRFFSFEV